MAINNEFSTHAAVAAGVAFQIHQVVTTFQMRKVRNESQNSLPFSPLAKRSSNNSKGTKPMKAIGAIPQVGHAADNNKPLSRADSILCDFFIARILSCKNTKNLWEHSSFSDYSTNVSFFTI
jgi:hypothetical protein